VDWRHSFYLNLIAHSSYTATVAICRYFVPHIISLRSTLCILLEALLNIALELEKKIEI